MAKKNDPQPVTVSTPKLDIARKATEELRKQFGDTIVFMGDDDKMHANVPVVSTGSLTLDIAIGVGGLPKGRITEIYGQESSGKTTLLLSAIAQAQQAPDSLAAFVDMEHALDPVWAKTIGVNMSMLTIAQPDTGEDALEIAQKLIASGVYSIVGIDSVAALVPRAEIEGDMGQSHMGLQARLMSQGLRKLNGIVNSTSTAVVFTNQLRQKIGIVYGDPTTTTGGNALKFYASLRLSVSRVATIKDSNGSIGNETKVSVKKNKLAPPYGEAKFEILFNEGISRVGEIIDLAVAQDLVKKSGAYYSMGENKLGQGKEKTRQFLMENPDIAFKLEQAIRESAGLPTLTTMPVYSKISTSRPPKTETEPVPEIFIDETEPEGTFSDES